MQFLLPIKTAATVAAAVRLDLMQKFTFLRSSLPDILPALA